jgi:hypothetical protein
MYMTGEKGEKGLNFVGSSGMSQAAPEASYLFNGQLYNGYTVREMIHSHSGEAYYDWLPSGFDDNGNPNGTMDMGVVEDMSNYYLRQDKLVPVFKIYEERSGEFFQYTVGDSRYGFEIKARKRGTYR